MYVTFNNMGNTGVDVKTNVCNLTDAFALAIVLRIMLYTFRQFNGVHCVLFRYCFYTLSITPKCQHV